ncbi:MAG: ribosome recycling factor [Planctomycetia bacterium]|nr:MAG: ribosome recycling factor [Planctomycetia bacterium]
MALDEILFAAEEGMDKALEFLKAEFRGVRTGRASPGLVDGLRVEVESYGSTMALRELANVGVAEGNVIVVKPFDPSTLKDIQRGIEKSGIGINPQNDGKVIRLPVPPLSGERRNQLVTQVSKAAEAQKVAVRNLRRDANKAIDAAQKAKAVTEDDAERSQEQVQKLTDEYVSKIDQLVTDKTKEIMEV